MAHDDAREARPSGWKRSTWDPPFLYGMKIAALLLKQWVRDLVVRLFYTNCFPYEADQSATNYYPYHWRKGHLLEQCVLFRRLFDENLEAGEILIPEGETTNAHGAPFPMHLDQGKGYLMMACHSTAYAELMRLKCEPSTKAMLSR